MTKDNPTHPKWKLIPEMDTGKRFMQVLLLILELILMAAALWPTCSLVLTYAPRARTAFHWVLLILGAILVFNYAYLLALLAFRLVIPRPKEGFFPRGSDGRPPREAFVYMLNALLMKARFSPPWADYFASLLANIFPLNYPFRRFFGPDTPSTTLGDTYRCVDPYLIEAGRNVQFGGFCTIAAHSFDHRGMTIRRTRIGDHAVIGATAFIGAGAEIGSHAVVAAGAVVPPGTVIRPHEFWAGNPARNFSKIFTQASTVWPKR